MTDKKKGTFNPITDFKPPPMTEEDRKLLAKQIKERPSPLAEQAKQQLVIGSDVDEQAKK
jgi:ribosome recycling factor